MHIKFLVEKVINYIVLMGTIRYNVKQVKQKPLKVCVTCEKILEMGGQPIMGGGGGGVAVVNK